MVDVSLILPSKTATCAEPVEVNFLNFLRYAFEFSRDRVWSNRLMRKELGPFAITRPPKPLPSMMAFVAGERFNREIFSQVEVWRTYRIDRHHKTGHASERLTKGLVRLAAGRRHKHYRKVIAPALTRETIAQSTGMILQTAAAEIAQWPRGELVDIWGQVRQLMQVMAVATLFGNERNRACPIAQSLNELSQEMLSISTIWCPINLPGIPYRRMLKRAERLESDIIDWSKSKRGESDPKHLLSLLVNSDDEHGRTPDLQSISGHIPTLFGGAFETSQSSVFWTLLLLSQHPKIAAELVDEINTLDMHASDVADALERLDLLDRVVKEAMRLMPAVPMQARISTVPTSIAGFPVPRRTYAFISAYCTNREPSVYAHADEFRPERWETIRPNQYQYLAFSAGARKCPGFWYGMASVKIAVAMILKQFRVDFSSAKPIDPRVSVVLYPRNGAMAVLRPQDQSLEPSHIRGAVSRLMPLAR